MILQQNTRQQTETRSKVGNMFGAAHRLRATGANPIDLMLGNPCDKPGPRFYQTFREILDESEREPGNPHSYVASAGLPEARWAMASYLTRRTGISFRDQHILMTSGCANALDICFASLVQPGSLDEILVPTPGFMEYGHILRLNRGIPVTVPMTADFRLDLQALDKAVTRRTRALILNFPSNPTGCVATESELKALADFLTARNRTLGREIVVLEDAPYDQIVFGARIHTMLEYYPHTIYMTSFSKTHGLAGERIGFMAVHPAIGDEGEHDLLCQVLANNLRFRSVSAPALIQRVVARLGCRPTVDVAAIKARIRRLEAALQLNGYKVIPAEGGMFIFAGIPDAFPSQQAWQDVALAGPEPLLTVPGQFFGGDRYARYLRFSITVPDDEIRRAEHRLREIEPQTGPRG